MPVLGTSPAGPARGPRPAEYLDDRARGEGHPEGEQETRPRLALECLAAQPAEEEHGGRPDGPGGCGREDEAPPRLGQAASAA